MSASEVHIGGALDFGAPSAEFRGASLQSLSNAALIADAIAIALGIVTFLALVARLRRRPVPGIGLVTAAIGIGVFGQFVRFSIAWRGGLASQEPVVGAISTMTAVLASAGLLRLVGEPLRGLRTTSLASSAISVFCSGCLVAWSLIVQPLVGTQPETRLVAGIVASAGGVFLAAYAIILLWRTLSPICRWLLVALLIDAGSSMVDFAHAIAPGLPRLFAVATWMVGLLVTMIATFRPGHGGDSHAFTTSQTYLHAPVILAVAACCAHVAFGQTVLPVMVIMLVGTVVGQIVGAASSNHANVSLARSLAQQLDVIADRERALKNAQSQFRAAFEQSALGMAIVAADGRIVTTNERYAALTGYSAAEIVGINVGDLAAEAGPHHAVLPSERGLVGGSTRFDKHFRRKDGSTFWGSVNVSEVTIDGVLYALDQLDDVTDHRVAVSQLEWAARHDPLTGLANRRQFMTLLSGALADADRKPWVLFIDLDRFKLVNDSLGHPTGDALLIEVGALIERTIRYEDLVARLGGDEFTVLLHDATEVEALGLAARLRRAFEDPIIVGTDPLRVSASIGIASGSETRVAADLLRDADLAMYRAKENGRARVEVFDDTVRAAVDRQHAAVTELRDALDNDVLDVWYQPIVRLTDRKLVGAEALVRVPSRFDPPITAAEFVSAAEDSGLIHRLGKTVMRQAFGQLAQWRSELAAAASMTMAVNISANQLADDAVIDDVTIALVDAGLPADAVWLELTESALAADVERADSRLRSLADLGVQLAVDDFGTGYASLAYLTRFPVRRLKIDRSFIDRMAHSASDREIVNAVLGLAATLHLDTVAEGIEHDEQAAVLEQLSCGYGQGFLYGKPMSSADFESAFLGSDRSEPTAPMVPTR